MCTVTVVPHAAGIRLMCNRDERRTRPAAVPPRVHELGGRRAVFPVDPQGGGSWIGVNDAGIALSLLNVARPGCVGVRSAGSPVQSRGLIVRELLRCGSLSHVLEVAASLDVSSFEMFTIVAAQERCVAVATSSGGRGVRCRRIALERPLLFTSSSLGDALVEAPRRRLFQRVVMHGRAGWLDGQARFHRHQWRRRPEISVRMERADALTVSHTAIDITRAGRVVAYEAPVSEHPSREGRAWCFLD